MSVQFLKYNQVYRSKFVTFSYPHVLDAHVRGYLAGIIKVFCVRSLEFLGYHAACVNERTELRNLIIMVLYGRDVHGNGIPIPMETQICQKWEWEWEEYM